MTKGWNPFRWRCKLRIEPREYHKNDLTAFLQKGDVILYRGEYRNFISALIMEFTRSPYSHAEIYVGDGWSVSAERYGLSLENHCNVEFIDIMRKTGGLSKEQQDVIAGKAYRSLAKPYEYLGLFGFPFGSLKAAARRSANQAYICSEIVAWCYKQAGIALVGDRPESIAAPEDLARAGDLQWLGAWRGSAPFPSARHRTFHPLQLNKRAGFAKWIVKHIADALSERDEDYKKLLLEHARGARESKYAAAENWYLDAVKEAQTALLEAGNQAERK
jgi:hypothetical protein